MPAERYIPLVKLKTVREARELGHEAAILCQHCHWLRGFHADKQVGYCVEQRGIRSTWHPSLCADYRET